MSGEPIQNCELRFQFKCPKQWEALGRTDDPGVRSCGHCQKSVYLCQSEPEVLEHARQGHCIAVPAKVLAARERLGDSEQAAVLAAQRGLPFISLHEHPVDLDLLQLVRTGLARKHCLVPVSRTGDTLVVAMSDPSHLEAIEEVMFVTECRVVVVVASRRDIERALDQALDDESGGLDLGVICVDEPLESESSTPAGKLIHLLLSDAHKKKAEQIRIEPTGSDMVIRLLVQGASRDVMRVPLKLQQQLLSELREQSGARPGQPGRLQLRFRMRSVPYAVHFHLTERGEEVVLHRLPQIV